MQKEITLFMDNWIYDANKMKGFFQKIYETLQLFPDVDLSFKARPKVSYSLRAKHRLQNKRDLFVVIDVIDDDPTSRWLSICFYADFISDPQCLGDTVPAGLAGEDACCFDIESLDTSEYILLLIKEAYKNAATT